MKKLINLIITLTFVSQPLISKGMPTIESIESNLKEDENKVKNIPELPAQDGITCEYDGSYLIIKFESGEGMASMMLSYASDGSEIDQVNFSASSDFVYYIGEINEPVRVEINGAGRYYCDVID